MLWLFGLFGWSSNVVVVSVLLFAFFPLEQIFVLF